MGKLKIGLYEQDITIEGPVDLPGQFYRRVSQGVESRLSANIFVCDSDGEQVILVACDMVSIQSELTKEVRRLTAQKCDIPDTSKIILSATHIHTMPAYATGAIALHAAEKYLPEGHKYVPVIDNVEVKDPVENFHFYAEKISDGIAKAWNMRDDAYISPEFGRAVVGHCRRVSYNDGTAEMYGIADKSTFDTLESGNDSAVELLYIFDKNKKPIGAIANIACPSQVMEHCSVVSSDYWGKARENLKKSINPDFVLVGLCSAAGCQAPRDMVRFVLPDTKDPNMTRDNVQRPRKTDPDMFGPEGAAELGRRVSDTIAYRLEFAKDNLISEAPVKHTVEILPLPYRKVTETERRMAKKAIDDFIAKANKTEYDAYDMNDLHIYAGILDRYELLETEQFYKPEIHIARIGDTAIATNPFELFLDYGNKIRARSHATQTMLIQLAVECGSYLPTERAEKGSHYSAYVASGKCGHIGGDILVAETLDKISELFD